MNKYKLIKTYPGSPELNDIAIQDNVFKNVYIVSETSLKEEQKIYDCDKYPEFWEKIVEKDYEILSFKRPNDLISKNDFNYSDDFIKSLLNSGHKIHSVKRLSDGEIFTIGDKLNKSYISNILLQQDIIWLMCQGNSINSRLNDAVKIKQPLFTTEDGVDIFKGDIIYSENKWKIWAKVVEDADIAPIKWFSTEEKVREYILMNKPCLSINDVNSIYKNTDFKKLKELVKSKL